MLSTNGSVLPGRQLWLMMILSHRSAPRIPRGQRKLEAALRESDPQKLPVMARAAELAIILRRQDLVNRRNG